MVTKFVTDASELSCVQQIDLLWSLCSLGQYDSRVVAPILTHLNHISFERLDNELPYNSFL